MQASSPPRRPSAARLCFLIFCFGMCAAMIAITIVRALRPADAGLARNLGNIALWLAPAVYCLIRKERAELPLLWGYAVFVFLASFLGSIWGFYGRIWWYDLATHTVSGYLLGFLGLFLVCRFADAKALHPAFVLFVCLSFAVACAGIWEIFEFVTDLLFDGTAQGSLQETVDGEMIRALNDTMEDIICGTIGAIVFAAHYLTHVLSGRSLLLGKMIEKYGSREPSSRR